MGMLNFLITHENYFLTRKLNSRWWYHKAAMIPWILYEAIIITLLEHMNRSTSIAFVSAAKFLQPYVQYIEHIKKFTIAYNNIFTIAYSGKLSLLEGNSDENTNLHRDVIETVNKQKLSIRKIRCGEKHVAAITSTGDLILWGDNEYGQCTIPPEYSGDNATKFSKVSCNQFSTAVITVAGELIIFGECSNFQTIIPNIKNDTFRKVSLGIACIAVITSSGKLITWSDSRNNQCYIPSTYTNSTFRKVSCGMYTVAAITTFDELILFGLKHHSKYKTKGANENYFRKVSCHMHTAGITSSGRLLIWGKCGNRRCRKKTTVNCSGKFSKVKCEGKNNAALTSSGNIISWCANPPREVNQQNPFYHQPEHIYF